jgi:hypothetical protein
MTTVQDEITIIFRKPIKVGEAEYTSIDLTEPTAGQLRKAAKAGDGLDVLCELIHLNSSVPKSVVDQMLHRDLDKAGDFFGRFGEQSPPTPGS